MLTAKATLKMVRISNKLVKIRKELNQLSYDIANSNPSPLSLLETNKFVCNEAADMLEEVCKHLTNNGTRF